MKQTTRINWTMSKRAKVSRMFTEEGYTVRQIADAFHVPESKIKNLIHRMGLKSTFENVGRFKAGVSSWNKGVKNSTGYSSTRFKPCKMPDGEIRIQRTKDGLRKFIYCGGKRTLLHRVVYLSANPGFQGVIRFIDNDPMNCELSNLTGISRAENMRANSAPAKSLKKKSIMMRVWMRRNFNAMNAKRMTNKA